MSENALLFIHALTGMHPGSGTALGVVDLPVQRERHTQWPTIPGSSLKGILRDACREKILVENPDLQDDHDNSGGSAKSKRSKANEDTKLVAVFGPPYDSAHEHAGALALTDARLLAFPVRSLKGVFAWVTCKAVLDRLSRDLSLIGRQLPGDVPAVDEHKVACSETLLVDGKSIVLEEFDFERTTDVGKVADWIASHAVADDATKGRIKSHLAVLSDCDFTHFVRHATEVVARTGLDYETKTVKNSALFYEEYLPAETLFYSLAIAEDSRSSKEKMTAADVLHWVSKNLPPIMQIGAGQTVGKGLCAVRLDAGKGE